MFCAGCARGPLPAEDGGPPTSIPIIPLDAAQEDDAARAPASTVDAALPEVDAGGPPQGLPDAGGVPDAGVDAGSPVASDCKPGTYVGTFEGAIQILGFISLPIDGEISINISTSSTGGDLVLENGTIEGEDQDGNPVHAEVAGTLQCASRQLVDGRLLNGTYVRTGLNMTVNFQGTVEATYAPGDVPSVSGTWETTGGLVERGSGTFSASFSTP